MKQTIEETTHRLSFFSEFCGEVSLRDEFVSLTD